MSVKETLQTEVVVIGAGVVGLAISRNLSKKHSVVLLERHSKFGQETSSRNSEVIHSGIYYPKDSKKTEWCIEGRKSLYAFCEEFHVPFAKCGKFVIATSETEEVYLGKLSEHCGHIAVAHSLVGGSDIAKAERLVLAKSGVYFPESGIVDSHSLMAKLEQLFIAQDGILAYGHEVKQISRAETGWKVEAQDQAGHLSIAADIIVNAAGLGAAELSNFALNTTQYEHRYCRGRYFSLLGKYQNKFQHLIYPVPPKDGLGVHVTIDLNGNSRLGPDVEWCSGVSYPLVDVLYDCDWEALRTPFLSSATRYLPSLQGADVSPGLIGVRPKLFVGGAAHSDFLVENHSGFIHCLGIESPGLTAALAIADAVQSLI